jgi:hypothetical protein
LFYVSNSINNFKEAVCKTRGQKATRPAIYNHVTMRRVRLNTDAVEKQDVLHILIVCVCVCILALITRHAERMRRIILSCVACPALPCFFFSHYLKRGTIFGKSF